MSTADQTFPDYAALGQTEEEAALLREHDEGETLHAYYSRKGDEGDGSHACEECGDDSSGLMHNNTWRSVDPLLGEGEDDL